ncbi:hypothetical protein Ptr902_13177 [Pyrenophora tritici-repentis]|nr:hypothetical protein Ptr902_13177 [Pyrenophora tritici-repentis]
MNTRLLRAESSLPTTGTDSQSGQTPRVTIAHASGIPSPSQGEYFRNDSLSGTNNSSYEWDVPNTFGYASPQTASSKTVSNDRPITPLEPGHLDDTFSDMLLNSQAWSNNVSDMFETFNWETEPGHNVKKRKRSDIDQRALDSYFTQVAPHFPFISRTRFNSLAAKGQSPSHGFSALKHAIVMTSGVVRDAEEQFYYSNARSGVNQSEQETDDVAFPNLETVQALILIARRELAKGLTNRATVTIARAMRAMMLMGGHRIVDDHIEGSRSVQRGMRNCTPDSQTLPQEMQQSWWALYTVNSCCAVREDIGIAIDSCQITTRLPQPYPTSPQFPQFTLEEFKPERFHGLLTPMSGIAMAAALTHNTLKHRHHSLTQGLFAYEFCSNHEVLEQSIERVIEALQGRRNACGASRALGDTILADVSIIILLGLRILLHFISIAKAHTMHLMDSLISRSQDICLTTARRMSTLLEAFSLETESSRRDYEVLSPFLATPLQHCAKVFLQTLRDRQASRLPEPSNGIASPMRTVCRELKLLCSDDKEIASTVAECEAALNNVDSSGSSGYGYGRSSRSASISDSSRDEWASSAWFDRTGPIW